MDFILDFIVIAVAFSLGAILTRLFFPSTEIVISEPVEVEVESEAAKQQIDFLKKQITYANNTIKDQRQRILTAADDLRGFKTNIEKAIIMAKDLEAENASLKKQLEEAASTKPIVEEVEEDDTFTKNQAVSAPSVRQLKSDLYNGVLWEAIETFHFLVEEGVEVDLFEAIEDLQEFPDWDFEEVDPEALLAEYNPLGSLEEVRKRATRLFILMAVYAYQNKNLLKTAAFFEAAYIAKYGDVERAAFADLGNLVKWPFISGKTQGILRPVWSTSLEM